MAGLRGNVRFTLRSLALAVLLIGSIQILAWQWPPWTCVAVLNGHDLPPEYVAFSPDGRLALTYRAYVSTPFGQREEGAHPYNSAWIWNAQTGAPVCLIRWGYSGLSTGFGAAGDISIRERSAYAPTLPPDGVPAFSEDGRWLIMHSSHEAGSPSAIFEVRTGLPVKRSRPVAFKPDELTENPLERRYYTTEPEPCGYQTSQTCKAQSNRILMRLANREESEIAVWDASRQVEVARWNPHARIDRIFLSANGQVALVSGYDYKPPSSGGVLSRALHFAQLYDVDKGRAIKTWTSENLSIDACGFWGKPEYATIYYYGYGTHMLDPASGREVGYLNGEIVCQLDDHRLICNPEVDGSQPHRIDVWDMRDWRLLRSLPGSLPDPRRTRTGPSILTTRDRSPGAYIESQGPFNDVRSEQILRLWSRDTLESLDAFRCPYAYYAADHETLWALSSDSMYGGLCLLDAGTHRRLREFSGDSVLSPDLRRIAVYRPGQSNAPISAWATAKLMDAHTGEPLCELHGHTRPITALAFSPDGTKLLTGSEDGAARLWLRLRPEQWWGAAWLPVFWVALASCLGLIWSLSRDTTDFRRVRFAALDLQADATHARKTSNSGVGQ